MKKDDILVSVDVITYNHELYIAQCLDGILNQKTNFNFEILIHDDASTDQTASIIREYQKRYPHIIKPIIQVENQYKKGITTTSEHFNFPRAKGKYIAMCEGDDFWIDPYKLQKQIDILESHPEYSIIFHEAVIYNDTNREYSGIYSKLENRVYTADEIFCNWIAPTASFCFRKSNIDYSIATDKAILNSDIIIMLMALSKGKAYGLSEKMSAYRIHEGGVTWNPNTRIDRIKKSIIHNLYIKKKFHFVNKKIIDYKISGLYLSLFWYYRREHDFPKMYITLFKAFYYDIFYVCSELKKRFK